MLLARASMSGGLCTAGDALACGYDRQALSRLARNGAAVRLGYGAYVERTSYAAASPEQRHRLATRAVVRGFEGRLAASHQSALTLLDLPLWQVPIKQIHVARTVVGHGRRSPALTVHRSYGPGDYHPVDGTLCVRPALAVLGTAMLCGVEAGVIAADAALAADIVSHHELRRYLNQLAHYPSVRNAQLAVDLADRLAESPGESRTRLVLRSMDLGSPVAQAEIRDEDGSLVGRVDFRYEQQRTIVEFDGLVKYGDAAFARTAASE